MSLLLENAAAWASYWPHATVLLTFALTIGAIQARRVIVTLLFESLQLANSGVGRIFHTGLFQPSPRELHIIKPLEVLSGQIPHDLDGFYMRTGPNPQFDALGGYHLFDGEAMIHCVQIKGGKATAYCNHWVRCERFNNESKAGHNIYMRIGDMRGIPGLLLMMVMQLFPYNLPGNKYEPKEQSAMGNTAIVCHNGRVLALNEASYPIEVKVDSQGKVTTGDVVRFDERLKHPFTAHPKIDPATNEMCIFGYELGLGGGGVTYSTVSAAGHLSSGTPIDVQKPQLLHDFGITPNYAIFVDQNLIFTPQALLQQSKQLPFAVENSFNARVGLLKRSDVQAGVTWFDIGRPAGWAAHVGNAWEDADGARVHIVVTQYDLLNLSAEDFSLGGGVGRLVRLTVHIETGRVDWTLLVNDPNLHLEFPVVSPQAVGQACGYIYVAYSDTRYSNNRAAFDGIARIDMTAAAEQGLCGKVAFPDGFKGAELSFVPPGPTAVATDGGRLRSREDGYIIGFITNERTKESRLAVFDTRNAFEDPVYPFDVQEPAMVRLPHRIPLGFHGLYIKSEDILAKRV